MTSTVAHKPAGTAEQQKLIRDVAIIIVTWNNLEGTANCLRHLEQVIPKEPQVLIVDNASNERVRGLLEQYQSRAAIETKFNKRNLGFSHAVNQGIRAIGNEADIILLNNDVLINDPLWISKLQNAAYSDEKIGIVGCRLINDQGLFLHAGIHLPPESYWGIELGGGELDIGQYQTNHDVEAITFALAYIKRSVIETIGLLDPSYFAYFEDVDYCFRARNVGFRIFYLGELTCVHLQGSSTRKDKSFFNSIYRDAQSVFIKKWKKSEYFSSENGLVWHSISNLPTGYSLSSLNIIKELQNRRIDVRYKYIYGKGTVFPYSERLSVDPVALAIQSRPLKNYPLQVAFSQADMFYKNFGSYRVGYTMFEADGLPREWVNQCNQMDEVWVPSSFNKTTFSNSGVKVPIFIMPLGIQKEHFNPYIRERRFSKRFTFLSIFEWSERKGQEILIRAFLNEFPKQDDALLVLKVFNPDIRNSIPLELSKAGISFNKKIRIVTVNSHISYDELEQCDDENVVVFINADVPYYQLGCLYRGVDCFVLPTRGEGWGLPVMEAMACSIPVIATEWSALCDFYNEEVGYPVRVKKLIPSITKSPYYEGLKWAEPDSEHLQYRMRYVFENRKKAEQKARQASEFILKNYSWENAISSMVQRVSEIYGSS
jgi:GT2 family glycosyltransferase